jgi:hypothetical protein
MVNIIQDETDENTWITKAVRSYPWQALQELAVQLQNLRSVLVSNAGDGTDPLDFKVVFERTVFSHSKECNQGKCAVHFHGLGLSATAESKLLYGLINLTSCL